MNERWCMLWLWVVVGVGGVGGCARDGGTVGGDDNAAQAASPRALRGGVVDEVALVRGWVEELTGEAMAGRGLGEPGLDVAEAWLVERMKEAGLEPGFVDAAGVYEAARPTAERRGLRGEGDGGVGWVQAFGARLRLRATTERMTLNGVELRAGEAFGALGLSTNGAFDAGVVFVGYGIQNRLHGYNSYAGMPEGLLKGKVAVAYRYEPMDGDGVSRWMRKEDRWSNGSNLVRKAEDAKALGAVGLVVVVPPGIEEERLRTVRETQPRDGTSVLPTVEITRRTWRLMLAEAGLGPGIDRAYRRLADEGDLVPEVLPGVRLAGEFVLESPLTRAANVAGMVMGQGELAGQVVLVGAHYDHLGLVRRSGGGKAGAYYPGADDNASGVSALLLAARRYAGWVQGLRGEAAERPRRTVVFVGFSAEERGLLGSTHLADHIDELRVWSRTGLSPTALEKPGYLDFSDEAPQQTRQQALEELKKIARKQKSEGGFSWVEATEDSEQPDQGEPQGEVVAMVNMDMVGRIRRGQLFVYGLASSPGWRARLGFANVLPGLRLVFGDSPWGPSDHRVFYHRDVPVLHFFTGLTGDYHTVRDTAETLNMEGVARVARLVGGLAAVLAWDEGGLKYQWVSEQDRWQKLAPNEEEKLD
ncbi:MAG: M28 family peptidase [Planctomycetota bacterium]